MIAKLFVYRIIDIADDIDVKRLKDRLKELELRPLRLNYFTPAYLNYTTPPVEMSEKTWHFSPTKATVITQVKFYSLGTVTITYELMIHGKDHKDIFSKSRAILNTSQEFEEKTKEIAKRSKELLEKELGIKTYEGFVEDYAILWIQDRFSQQGVNGLKGPIAQFLRNEEAELSEYEIREALRYHFSYTPNDLTVVDWDRAVTIGKNPEDDVWDVLEYTNMQLLEMRYYDHELDKRITEIYEFSKERRVPIIGFYHMYNMMKKTLEIYVDFSAVEDRITNFLRLTGDEYLSRVYIAASQRLNMRSTQESLKERLVDTKELYEMLSAEASAIRAEILEVIIILLIAFEIIFALV